MNTDTFPNTNIAGKHSYFKNQKKTIREVVCFSWSPSHLSRTLPGRHRPSVGNLIWRLYGLIKPLVQSPAWETAELVMWVQAGLTPLHWTASNKEEHQETAFKYHWPVTNGFVAYAESYQVTCHCVKCSALGMAPRFASVLSSQGTHTSGSSDRTVKARDSLSYACDVSHEQKVTEFRQRKEST